ncbi:penicillin-binding transpeptidase domain-containing protein [Clostridium sp.]|uniref:penicillin-binding transpeptidase domain-containing protein n=1 Tax=Clostridium sp. TaxID=1506 RepID=UPI0025C06864|nr:penicillin-binding transpeptidase domain-containing protein [Clostridium sp.]
MRTKISGMLREKNKEKNQFSRFNALVIIMLIIFTAIISKLVNIQVVNGEGYRETANQKDNKIISTPAPRGEIIDRNGTILATSETSSILTFTNTDESEEVFFTTMDKVFKILDDKSIDDDKKKAIQVDEFLLKVNTSDDKKYTEYSFDFKTQDKPSQDWTELRFKKDRGFDTDVITELYGDKRIDDLSDDELKKVDAKLLEITPEEVFNELIVQYKIAEINGFESKSKEELRRYMLVKDSLWMQSFSGYKPVIIANNFSRERSFIFEQMQSEIPGISVLTQPIRVYPNKDLGSAFLGYISKINTWNKDKYEEKGYDISTDYIGAAGIEASFEDVLRGTKGQESISVNKQGRKVKSLGKIETYPGQTIQLNIDVDMQYAAEKSLDAVMLDLQKQGKVKDVNTTNANRGAVVVLDVNTGKVLALASRPGYDPNMFAVPGRLTSELYNSYLNPDIEKLGLEYIRKRGLTKLEGVLTYKDIEEKTETEKEQIILDYMFPIDKNIEGNTTIRRDNNDIFPKPTFNNATKSLIPPGSIFKPLTAIAGLEEGVINETTKVLDGGGVLHGYYNKRYPDVTSACWRFNDSNFGHGLIDVKEALKVSCNYFFYEVADLLFAKGGENKNGLDLIAKYAWKFGLGVDSSGDKKPYTGIEIPESFGQVYNYESSREILSNIYISNMINYLQEGTNRVQGKYKPLDMMPQKESGSKKEIDEIKKANEQNKVFLAYAKAEMKKLDGEYDSTNNLKKLIEASEVLKNNKYTVKDIEDMAAVVNGEINNCRNEISSAANAYNAAIGQGFNVFTPLQLANYVATMVNGGNRYETHLVDKFLDPDGNVIKEIEPVVLEKTGVSDKTIKLIKEGMLEVTSNKGGTAYSVFGDFPILSGGKTGSATFNDTIQSALGRTSYGYYIGFAPYDKPEIAVCAVVFDGGHGAYVAPIAKAVYEQYFKDAILKKDPEYKFQVDPKEKTANIEINKDSGGLSPD